MLREEEVSTKGEREYVLTPVPGTSFFSPDNGGFDPYRAYSVINDFNTLETKGFVGGN